MELKNANEIDFTSILTPLKITGKKKKETPAGDGFLEAFNALPQELADSNFLSAYIRNKAIAKTRRDLNKQEKEQTASNLKKLKTQEDEARVKGEKVAAFRSKDFIINIWLSPKGKYYREIIARPGLMINK